ncbi:MAG TPA: hypothetical protein ACQGQI_06415 [Xylella sp.]
MMKYQYLVRSIADMDFPEFKLQLGYKVVMLVSQVVVVDLFFAGSKRYSVCGYTPGSLPLNMCWMFALVRQGARLRYECSSEPPAYGRQRQITFVDSKMMLAARCKTR